MSGVFGLISQPLAGHVRPLIDKLSATLTHRPWYVAESHVDEDAGVGLGRIGIGIFNQELQPARSQDGRLMLFMAGELYTRDWIRTALAGDGRSLRDKSDPDMILQLYQDRGLESIADLDGAFVIAVLDWEQRKSIIVNDRFGLYPTYYAHGDDWFIFGPEVKAVISLPQVSRTLRDDAIAEFMRFQHLLGFKTFFRDVVMLPPASILTYDLSQGHLDVCAYWDWGKAPHPPTSITFDEAVEEASRLLRNTLNKLTDDKRVGVFLSGGLDGRMILGMLPPKREPVHTFTFGQPGCRDEVYARRIAQTAGAQHHYYPYDDGRWIHDFADWRLELTEGFHPWYHMHGIDVMDDARQSIEVNLSGLGDLLWTQPNFTPRSVMEARDEISFGTQLFELYCQRYTWPGLSYADERVLYTESFLPRVRDVAHDSFVSELGRYAHLPFAQRLTAFNLVNHFLRYIFHSAVLGRSHIEYRFPYFDPELAAFCYSLPFELGEDRRLQKAILARYAHHQAKVPTTDEELPISASERAHSWAYLRQKARKGIHTYVAPLFPSHATLYADYENWLRADLRPWAEGILFDDRTLSRGIFRPEALRSLMDRHLAGDEPNTLGKIAPVITFEMMLRRFIDEPLEPTYARPAIRERL